MLPQPGLDLAQLNPVPADLDLVVGAAAQQHEPAGREGVGQIPGRVHDVASVRAYRVRQEPLRGQLGPVQVSPGYPAPPDVQLARCPGRDWPALLVQQVDLHVRQRVAARRRRAIVAQTVASVGP